MKKIFNLIIALLLVSSCATMGRDDRIQEAEAHYKLGVAYSNEDKVQQAFVEFHKALELDPRNKEVLNALGIIHLLQFDEIEQAISYFEESVKADPEYSEAYNNLGYAHQKAGEFEKAISYYKKALSNPIYPTAEKAYYNMGFSYYRLGEFDAALNSFKEAIKRAPDLSLAYLGLALIYNATGKYGDASTAMAQAIKLSPVYRGDREKAAQDFAVKKLGAKGYEERDYRDYMEILKY